MGESGAVPQNREILVRWTVVYSSRIRERDWEMLGEWGRGGEGAIVHMCRSILYLLSF